MVPVGKVASEVLSFQEQSNKTSRISNTVPLSTCSSRFRSLAFGDVLEGKACEPSHAAEDGIACNRNFDVLLLKQLRWLQYSLGV